MTPRTHLAVRAVGDGRLEFTRLPVTQPASSQVRIRVEACGICRLDAATIEGGFPGLVYPRIPGHEIVGRIEALGEGVLHYAIGERVAVGLLAERCGHCAACLCGDVGTCAGVIISGASVDGGYAETMIAHQNALVSVPEGLNPIDAAPLLCAGVAISNALKTSCAQPGEVVAVCGIDSFGLLTLQFAQHMLFRTVLIGRGARHARTASALGAWRYIDADAEDAAALLQAVGGAAAIVAAPSSEPSASTLVGGLRPDGKLVVAGSGASVRLHIASPTELTDVLEFSAAKKIRPLVETTSLVGACDAYARVMRDTARFRVIGHVRCRMSLVLGWRHS
jgi:D-arabinose 1-dehydrogenase-like Zn-dependent alcohol dehydrogenase